MPDATSEGAGRDALKLARELRADDALIVLLSGGASALMAVPAAGLTLDDKRAATAQRPVDHVGARVADHLTGKANP